MLALYRLKTPTKKVLPFERRCARIAWNMGMVSQSGGKGLFALVVAVCLCVLSACLYDAAVVVALSLSIAFVPFYPHHLLSKGKTFRTRINSLQ